MPFSPPEPEAELVQYKHDRFRLAADFRFTYEDPYDQNQKRPYTVSQRGIGGAGTDLASVPSLLWWYVGSYGRHTNAALLHDVLVRRKGFDRGRADLAFRHALAESDVPLIRRWLMYTAVSLETSSRRFGGRAALAVLILIPVALIVAASWHAIEEPGWVSGALVAALLVVWALLMRARAFWLPVGVVLVGAPYAVVWWFKRTSGLLEVPAVLIRNAWASVARKTFGKSKPGTWRRETLSGEFDATRVDFLVSQEIAAEDDR